MNSEVAVVYHYCETGDIAKENLEFFLRCGYDKKIDYLIIIAGGTTVNLPVVDNIRYIFVRNSQFDFGGIAYALNSRILQVERYKYFIFVNSSVRGPFLPRYHRGTWAETFVRMIAGDVKLAGSTINILSSSSPFSYAFKRAYGFSEPFSHVQSMTFVMDQPTLRFLVQLGFFEREIGSTKDDAIIHYEILLSQLILKNGWNISCLLPEYQRIDYRRSHNDINPTSVQGDPCFGSAYFGRSLHPFETIFVKSNRNIIDLSLLRLLQASQISAATESSAYLCKKCETILDDVVSAWKGHKNFAIWLIHRLAPETIVDLGVDFGYSTFCFAISGIGHVYAVDTFEGDEHAGFRNTQESVESIIKKLGLDNITLVSGTFENVARSWDKELDVLHIDGLHTYEAVRRDYESWVKFVKPTGVILLHDTCVDSFGVRRLFDQIDLPKANFVHSNGLGVLSQDRELIREIAAKFEALIEGSELRRTTASATAKERRSDNTRASAWYTFRSALRRPGRIARFVRFGKRAMDRVCARGGP
jgi:hypothetical protein